MIRYVKLYNYKSLKDLTVDFTKTIGNPKNLVLIYGENGVGKTNFVNSFYTLDDLINTRYYIDRFQGIMEDLRHKKLPDELIADIVKNNVKDIKGIIKSSKTIESEENMVLEYGFQINGKNGMYRIEMNNDEIVSETLKYVLNKNETTYFNISTEFIKKKDKGMSSKMFPDKDYRMEFYDLLEKYWGKHSLISILDYEFHDKKRGYINERVNPGLLEVNRYLQTICTRIVGENSFGSYRTKYPLLWALREGKIKVDESSKLDQVEKLINYFFTTIYADVKEAFYKREKKDNEIEYHLFFKKLIYGKIREIDFDMESSGTKNLLNILRYLISAYDGDIVVIDELDTGIHDILIDNILNSFASEIRGQLIATTHNTMLIESDEIDNESIYVFNVDKNGKKELFPITEFERIQNNHNVRKRYISGLYGGIPSSGELDFEDLIDELQSE